MLHTLQPTGLRAFRLLTWQLALPAQPALFSLTVPRGPVVVHARLLADGTQVLVRPAGEPPRWSETVGAFPDAGPLPASRTLTVAGGSLALVSSARMLMPPDFRARVEALVADLGPRDDALLGVSPDGWAVAIEVLPAAAGVLGWRTWHADPLAGTLTGTRTAVLLERTGADGDERREPVVQPVA